MGSVRDVPVDLWFPSSSLGTRWSSSTRSVSRGSQAGAWEPERNQASPQSVTVSLFSIFTTREWTAVFPKLQDPHPKNRLPDRQGCHLTPDFLASSLIIEL